VLENATQAQAKVAWNQGNATEEPTQLYSLVSHDLPQR
jgi:hypothetical protein